MPVSQRKKPSVKEPLPASERVRKHFRSLVAQIEGGHLKNALKTCDKILRLEPNDPDALQGKLALLLHTEQYALALELSETFFQETQMSFSLAFGKAYALYRLNREKDASNVVKEINPQDEHEVRGVKHMEAQIEYRRGNYQKAQGLYSTIFDSSPPHSDEQSDSLTNLTASQVHLDFLQAGFLRSLHTLPQPVIGTLEDIPPPLLASKHPVLNTAFAPQPVQERKKMRMSRIPKGVVPGVTPPPDPERWLKKSERTNLYHHGIKRRKATAGGAMQGSLVEGSSKGSSGKGKKRK
ncbi:hypothetical protein K439DRAFT_1383393 [Ramaria rubella]|nr:hypothetical protein K439DRAFT_1383393 [Ramaria rubella]